MRQSVPGGSGGDLRDPSLPTREFDVGGVTWIAEVRGEALSGTPGDAGARVLLVTFREEANDEPEFETLQPGESLAAVSELELVEMLEEAVPFRKMERDEGLFDDTRRRRTPRRG